jgi:hypothetical protein
LVRARLEARFLFVVIAFGCQVACMVVPIVVLWGLAQAFSSVVAILFIGLVAIPTAVVAVIWLLGLVDRRYLEVKYGRRRLQEDAEDGWRPAGPLESILPVSVVIAMIGLVVWLVIFASHSPSGREQFIP